MIRHVVIVGAVASSLISFNAVAQDHTPDKDAIASAHAKQEYSPYVGRQYPTRVLWCETHLHTAVSVDAGTMCTVGQEDAFRFARGEEVMTTHGLSIGSPELITVWEDPDFNPAERAFYYARVIEIPTPRWTAYESLRFGVKMSDNVPMDAQERAYTSPIWYTPTNQTGATRKRNYSNGGE